MLSDNKKTIRHLSIFISIALLCGWLGVWLDRHLPGQPGNESLGMLLWLVVPLLAAIGLLLFGGGSWKALRLKPNLQKNIPWYLTAILIYPLTTGLVLLLGSSTGWIHFENFRIELYFSTFLNFILINFIKNFFEEAVWRGYLTEQLLKIKTKDLWLYLIVGGVWGAWHLPYYLHFLPDSEIYQVLPVSSMYFALWAIVSMIGWSVMFVELYRITQSVWPVVVLHTIEDSVINHLIFDKHILIEQGKEIIVSPIVGTAPLCIYIIIGLVLRSIRIRKEKSIV
jgi:uncharacterized membrane protein YsdA (DUF1294 family)